MIAAKQNTLFFWMFIFPKSRLSSSSGMVIFVSKCYGAMACIPGRPPVQDLLISINNDASGPIFMKDFLQSDPFPTFKIVVWWYLWASAMVLWLVFQVDRQYRTCLFQSTMMPVDRYSWRISCSLTRFQRSRVAKQIQVIIKVAWVFYSAVLNGESLPPHKNICHGQKLD